MSGWLTDRDAAIDPVGPQCTEGFIHAVTSRADVHLHPLNVFSISISVSTSVEIPECITQTISLFTFVRINSTAFLFQFCWNGANACIKIGRLVQQDWMSCANLWNDCKLTAFPWVFCRSNFSKHGCNKKWICGFKPSKTSKGCHGNMELCTAVVGLGLVVHCLMDEVKDNFGAIITGSLGGCCCYLPGYCKSCHHHVISMFATSLLRCHMWQQIKQPF